MEVCYIGKIKYEIFIGILAVIAVILAILDMTLGLSDWMIIVDNIILVIFIFEYIVRFLLAKDKILFIKSNILDLIAIIPFNSIFKIFRVFKMARLLKTARILKIFKLSKILAYLFRAGKKTKLFLNTNGFKYMLMLSCFMILLGGIVIQYAENMGFADSIWWAFVTVTTVGYGDISPTTVIGRVMATILMLVGIGLIGALTSTITSYFFAKGNSSIKNDVIETIKTKLDNIEQLSDDEIDDICKILKTLNK